MTHPKTISINGKLVAVKESGVGENAIVFIHGNSMNSATWLPQFTDDELQKNFRMIAIDLPGNGDSQWLSDTSGYGLKGLAEVVKQVVENLQLNKFVLVGQSYGTNVVGEITPPLNGCAGIMLVSPCILNDQFHPGEVLIANPLGYIMMADNPPENDLREFINSVTKETGIAERFYLSYRNTDALFRQELGNVMMSGGWTDELGNIQKWGIPVCVIFGKEETLININYLDSYPPLWKGKVHVFEKAGHVVNEETPTDFNQILTDFALDVFK